MSGVGLRPPYSPGVTIFDLLQAVTVLDEPEPHRPPAGPMAQYAVGQLSAEQIQTAYGMRTDGDLLPPHVARAIRAFDVPALHGMRFTCSHRSFHTELDAALTAALPGTSWDTAARRSDGGLVEKYGLLDGWYATSPDRETGQLMVLELAGTATAPGRTWQPGTPFGDVIEVAVNRATWANVGGIGFGTGFYM